MYGRERKYGVHSAYEEAVFDLIPASTGRSRYSRMKSLKLMPRRVDSIKVEKVVLGFHTTCTVSDIQHAKWYRNGGTGGVLRTGLRSTLH